MSVIIGRTLFLVAVAFALIVIFTLYSASIQLVGIVLGGSIYNFGLRQQDHRARFGG